MCSVVDPNQCPDPVLITNDGEAGVSQGEVTHSGVGMTCSVGEGRTKRSPMPHHKDTPLQRLDTRRHALPNTLQCLRVFCTRSAPRSVSDLGVGLSLPGPESTLTEPYIARQRQSGRQERCRLDSAVKVGADELRRARELPPLPETREALPEGARLDTPSVIERDIALPLPAVLRIPGSLPMSNQKKGLWHLLARWHEGRLGVFRCR